MAFLIKNGSINTTGDIEIAQGSPVNADGSRHTLGVEAIDWGNATVTIFAKFRNKWIPVVDDAGDPLAFIEDAVSTELNRYESFWQIGAKITGATGATEGIYVRYQ